MAPYMNPTTKDEPGPNPNGDGEAGATQNDDGSVTVYDENDCYITYSGGSGPWRDSNPGNLNGDPQKDGQIGTDGNGKAIFPDEQTGRDALEKEIGDAGRLN